MDRIHHRDKQQEGTAKPTGKAGKAGPRSWELSQYIYQEKPEDAKRSSHGDPRLESHGQHQHPDSDFIPHDGDHESLHPAFGFGTTPDLEAHAPSASDQGTLAGCFFRRPRTSDDSSKVYSVPDSGHNVSPPQNHN